MFSTIDQTLNLKRLWIRLIGLEISDGARTIMLIRNRQKVRYER